MSMTLEQVLELGFRAGFIRACNWPAPVSQDVDSPAFAKELAQFIEAHTPITQPAQSVDVQWVETPPAESGWYWHWDGECYRMHFVFARPGHSYLCTEGEPYGPGQKRNFQTVQRMGGKWSSKVEPPPLADKLTAALQEKGNGSF